MRKQLKITLLAGLTAAISPVMAQSTTTASQITVATSGTNSISCSDNLVSGGNFIVQSWSFGGQNPAATASTSSGAGAGAGRSTLTTLAVNKLFDSCSAALFELTMNGKSIQNLTLTQAHSGGTQTDTIIIKLANVIVASYQLTGTTASGSPTESITLAFQSITIKDPNASPSGTVTWTQASWNQATNSAQGPQ